MTISLNSTSQRAAKRLADAFADGDAEQVEAAFEQLQGDLAEDLAAQYRQAVASNDAAVLAQRGFRQLTDSERRYYERVIEDLRDRRVSQATDPAGVVTVAGDNAMPEDMMPQTIIDQVMKDLVASHPLLAAVNMVPTGPLVKWLKNNHPEQLAKWGELEGGIDKEVTSAFEVVSLGMNKLSCFAMVSVDMLKLGPVWLDGYVRTVMGEAMSCALESGIVKGTGIGGEPVGMIRKVAKDVTVNQSTGYPAKTAKAVADFSPASYGALVAPLTKDENGKQKADGCLSSLTLVCNTTDWLTKVMPATTVLNASGEYKNNILPIPTRVITSNFLDEGKAVLGLMDEYSLFVGGSRGIEYSDEYKFLEDRRVFKTVQYANGRADDDTSFVYLDVSKLDPAYITVKAKTDAAASGGGAETGK